MDLRVNMKNNYKAWAIDIKDFANKQTDKERLAFLIGFAVLAPSSHYTNALRSKPNDDV